MTIYSVSQGGVVNAQDVTQFYQLLTGSMTDQPVSISNRIRAQMTGANGGSGGYVGATTSGAPSSGTFNAGDFIVDATGIGYTCTAAGTPGTWLQSSPYRQAIVLTGTQAAVTFGTIPTTLQYGRIRWVARGDNAAEAVVFYLRVNSDTAANYYGQLTSTNNTTTSNSNTVGANQIQVGVMTGSTAASQVYGSGTIDAAFGTASRKTTGTFASESWPSTAGSYVNSGGFMYNITGTVSALTLFPFSGNFVAGSAFYLDAWA